MRVPLLLVVVAGCTHHKNITEAHELAGDEVEVSGMYGHTVTAVVIAGPGGVTFVDKANNGVIPYNEVYKIDDTSHVVGAVQGLGIGGGLGVLLGAGLGYAGGDDECDEESHGGCLFSFTAEERAVFGGVVLGVLGGLVGLIVGGVKGSTTIYQRDSSAMSIKPVGPPGSVGGVTIAF